MPNARRSSRHRTRSVIRSASQRGLAISFGSRSEGGYVVAILAGAELALALAVERRERVYKGPTTSRTSAFHERRGGRSTAPTEFEMRDGDGARGAIAAAMETVVPTITDVPALEPWASRRHGFGGWRAGVGRDPGGMGRVGDSGGCDFVSLSCAR